MSENQNQNPPELFGIDPDCTWEHSLPGGASVTLKAPTAALDQEWQSSRARLLVACRKRCPESFKVMQRVEPIAESERSEEDVKALAHAQEVIEDVWQELSLADDSLPLMRRIMAACVVGWSGFRGAFPKDANRIIDFFPSSHRLQVVSAIMRGAELTKEESEGL